MITITNPLTNQTISFNSMFRPLSRISNVCQNDSHNSCLQAPELMVQKFTFAEAKKYCCLCLCHDKEVN